MAAPAYTDITGSIRALLDDLNLPGGSTFTDPYVQKYVQMAQETLLGTLISNSVERLKFRTTLTVPANTTVLNFSWSAVPSSPTLPDELIVPDQLWESKVGGVNEDYIPMSGPAELPRIPAADTLRYFNWVGGELTLLGATTSRLVRMDYWGYLPAIQPAGRLLIVNGGNAVAFLACSYICSARGQHQAAASFATFPDGGLPIGGRAGYEITQIINTEIKDQQSEPARRRPYFGRNRYNNADYWIRSRS